MEHNDQHFYFRINLNKYGEIRMREEAEQRTYLNAILFFVITSVLLYGVFWFVLYGSIQRKLQNRVTFKQTVEKELKGFQRDSLSLSIADLENLSKYNKRIFWTRKLQALSEKTSDRMAITHFAYKNGTFSLFGITKVDKTQKEFDLIDDFISTLKSNELISTDFPDIKFVKSLRDKEQDVDIIRFQIDCKDEKKAKESRLAKRRTKS
jgi:hypothetical protein